MERTLKNHTQPQINKKRQSKIWTVATSRAYALACLVVTACCYWPLAILHDWTRAKLPWLAKNLWPGDANPQTDVDGPEFVLGAPCREFWMYDRAKPGHRGFLPSVAGPVVGTVLGRICNAIWAGIATDNGRSEGDNSTSDDTLLLAGLIKDRATGAPIRGAIVSAWQADPRSTPAKYSDLDLDFDFRGDVHADPVTGKFALGTLYPVSIMAYSPSALYVANAALGFLPSIVLWIWCRLTSRHLPTFFRRPPHIHFYVRAPEYKKLCTQLYFPDRLAAGEFDRMVKEDPAHFNSALQVSPATLLHPSRRDEADETLRGLPPTLWAAIFNFALDRA
jgi:protocatechuate 3,4-dioxygenase beta subunit